MYVCCCCGLTDADIRGAGRSGAFASFEDWARVSECGTICESCEGQARALFEGSVGASSGCACDGHCQCAAPG